MIEKVITLENISLVDFLGIQNVNLKKITESYPKSKIIARGDEIKIIGSKVDVKEINELIYLLLEHFNRFGSISEDKIEDYILLENKKHFEERESHDIIVHGVKGAPIKPKTKNQIQLVKEIKQHDLVFAVGPAGTGKTFVAVAMAVAALKNKKVSKIIISRPAVEAGESLGFLPGDMTEKVDPYLRPIYDALEDMIPSEKLVYYKEHNIIEIAPLAYMRGRTLKNAFVLLDEAQNTTPSQIKMFMTRLGTDSKMVITGDHTQVDLPNRQKSGLVDALNVLDGVNGVGIVKLQQEDVMRHKVVKHIIAAYNKVEKTS
ncbi:PhoH family protein [Cyclobacteriaceae bacterium]|nr:PhoH family protein [Cyclobacteriaceae bacterium]